MPVQTTGDLAQALWGEFRDERTRFERFGPIIRRVTLHKCRAHGPQATVIPIEHSITAFCGLNGTGKSTILQTCAAAYSATAGAGYEPDRFLLVGAMDPHPYADGEVAFEYLPPPGNNPGQEHDARRTVSLGFSDGKWKVIDGSRRPSRSVLFIGVSDHAPAHELSGWLRKAFHEAHWEGAPIPLSETTLTWARVILTAAYRSLHQGTAKAGENTHPLLLAATDQGTYSEANMGLGEARAIWIVNRIEQMDDKSLVLIEEPETALHPKAQHILGRYLNEVVRRKHHQVMITTHSRDLLSALHDKSRIYLSRAREGIVPAFGLSADVCDCLMTDGHRAAVVVVVEDAFAATLTMALIRRIDMQFSRTVCVVPADRQQCDGGNKDNVKNAADVLGRIREQVIAMLDEEPTSGGARRTRGNVPLMYLPGPEAPEVKVFSCEKTKHWLSTIGYDFDNHRSELGADHHKWPEQIAACLRMDQSRVVEESCDRFSEGIAIEQLRNFVDEIKVARVKRTA